MDTMNINAVKGSRVQYCYGDNGTKGDQETARLHLEIGKEYTVDRTVVGTSCTRVYLDEVPGVSFNSVLFCDVTADAEAEEWLEKRWAAFMEAMQGGAIYRKGEMYANFMNTMRPEVYEQHADHRRLRSLTRRQAARLRGVVNALRGEPAPDTLWSHHDAELLAKDAVEQIQEGVKALTTLKGFVENVTLKAVISEALAIMKPRECPNCGTTQITSGMHVEEFPYRAPPETVQLKAEVRVFSCYECEQMWTDHTGEAARQAAVDKFVLAERGIVS